TRARQLHSVTHVQHAAVRPISDRQRFVCARIREVAAIWLLVALAALAPGPSYAADSVTSFKEAYARYQAKIAAGRPPRAALDDAKTAYELGRAQFGADDVNTGGLAINYGMALLDSYDGSDRERLVQARTVLRESLAIFGHNFGDDSMRLIDPL